MEFILFEAQVQLFFLGKNVVSQERETTWQFVKTELLMQKFNVFTEKRIWVIINGYHKNPQL